LKCVCLYDELIRTITDLSEGIQLHSLIGPDYLQQYKLFLDIEDRQQMMSNKNV